MILPLMNVPFAELRPRPIRRLRQRTAGRGGARRDFGELQIAFRRPAEDHFRLDGNLALVGDFDELGLIVSHM